MRVSSLLIDCRTVELSGYLRHRRHKTNMRQESYKTLKLSQIMNEEVEYLIRMEHFDLILRSNYPNRKRFNLFY